MQSSNLDSHFCHKGFTLIELIVGMVVLAISFSVLTTLIYPVAQQSADQLHQVKAAELAQSVLNEIQNKAFDNNSDMAGGRIRCGESDAPICTSSILLGPEDGNDGRPDNNESTRDLYNDVDDYNGLDYEAGMIENSQGQLLDLYIGYTMNVTVCNDAGYNGSCQGNTSTAKFITVTITTPTDFSMSFSTYRVNF